MKTISKIFAALAISAAVASPAFAGGLFTDIGRAIEDLGYGIASPCGCVVPVPYQPCVPRPRGVKWQGDPNSEINEVLRKLGLGYPK